MPDWDLLGIRGVRLPVVQAMLDLKLVGQFIGCSMPKVEVRTCAISSLQQLDGPCTRVQYLASNSWMARAHVRNI